MNTRPAATTWSAVLQRAIEQGLLPADAQNMSPEANKHPWPVVLLSLFGAQMAALPLIGFVLTLFGEAMTRGVGPYLFGPLITLAACVVLRSRKLPLFAENLALIALTIGTGLLFFGLVRDFSKNGYLICAAISLTLAIAVPVNWVRAVLGSMAAGMCYGSVLDFFRYNHIWNIALLQTLAWVGALWAQRNLLVQGDQAESASALEWLLVGWIAQVLCTFALLSGMSFIAGGALGSGAGWGFGADMLAREVIGQSGRHLFDTAHLQAGISALLVIGAGVWAASRWASLRSPASLGLTAVLAALAWFMPTLGPVACIGAILLITRRPVQAGAAALAAAWIIGAFYYSLRWDLVMKAQVLILAGLVLGILAWLACRQHLSAKTPSQALTRPALLLLTLGAIATFGVINVGIWQKEDIIAHGRPVFIKLAPIDPRSLMQGDYMALNFEMPAALQQALAVESKLEHQEAIATIDARGIATVTRLASTGAPTAGEIRIELIPKNGRWIVVTDAWFFKEGDSARWSKARYGEFRVKPNGQALLVGMADENLQVLK